VLLTLPVSHNSGEFFPFVKAMFTATSAVCVTGLAVADTLTEFSFFGQVVIILLIQLGGLGLMTIATLLFIIAGKRITLKERLILQEAYSQTDLSGLVRLTLKIAKYAFTLEGIGALILALCFFKDYGFLQGLWMGVFHSISSFCNAGFDLVGTGSSLVTLYDRPVIILTTSLLIILGGIGFMVINDFFVHKKEHRKFSLHTKVALFMTAFLLTFGTVGYCFLEWNNPNTMGNMSFLNKILSAFFQSVTARTAGFNSIPQGELTTVSKILTNSLMFIGASPGGTGGGIKTTTFFVVVAMFFAGARGKEEIVAFKHSIKVKTALKSFSILVLGLLIVLTTTSIVYHFEQLVSVGVSYSDALFESFSAFGTVGLSVGITPTLSDPSLITIAFCMFLGRLGSLILGLIVVGNGHGLLIKYSDYKLIVG
ncbi:MAG: TrkH family potassium uptake protein, partial [Clostridia bacterium]